MLECIEDKRQQSKVRYTIKEIILIVFCCTLSAVDSWEDMEIWAKHYIHLFREYLPYENGIPSHDTIQRVMALIGHNVVLATINHALAPHDRRNLYAPIHIGKNVWIGSNATILQGVTIGDGSVIGAGSVVTKSIPENSVAVGVPAKVIRKVEE